MVSTDSKSETIEVGLEQQPYLEYWVVLQASCHKFAHHPLQSGTSIQLVDLFRSVAPVAGHTQSSCSMPPYLQYRRLANGEDSTQGFEDLSFQRVWDGYLAVR